MSGTTDIFTPGVRRFVFFIALLSFAATVVALLYGAGLTEPSPGTVDSYGDGPIGHRAFVEFLEESGFHITRSQRDDFMTPRAPLLFLEPRERASSEGREHGFAEALDARTVAGSPTLLLLPKWHLDPGALEVEPASGVHITALLDAAFPGSEVGIDNEGGRTDAARAHALFGPLGTFEVEVPWLQTFQNLPDHAEVLLATASGPVVIREVGTGLVLVSDPDLLHNWNLQRRDNARLWHELLVGVFATDTVVVDEVFHGHSKQLSLSAGLGSFPAVLLTIHFLGLLLLLLLAGSRRFGPAVAAPPPYASGPGESIGVAASVLAEGEQPGRLAWGYIEQVLADLADRLGVAQAATDSAGRAVAIDRVAQRRGVPPVAQKLLQEVRLLGGSNDRRLRAALDLARHAHAFRRRLLERAPAPKESR